MEQIRMLVEYEDIIKYLLDEQLIGVKGIVDGDLAIIDVSRRNRNFKVLSDNTPSYFLKQEIRNSDRENKKYGTVEYESKVYLTINKVFEDRPFHKCLPRYYNYDAKNHLLILEAIDGHISVADYHIRRRYFSSQTAKELGKVIADLHHIDESKKIKIQKSLGVLNNPPWVFFLLEPHQWTYFNSSTSNIEFIKIIQQSDELCRLLTDLRRQWRNDTLIHCDLKWVNCLIPITSSQRITTGIKIVDWEFARIGDPCWDIGTVFGEYLNFWLSSIPLSTELPPDKYLSMAQFPLKKMQPSIHAFWKAYILHSSLEQEETTEWLLRATKYAGVWLLQFAFEELQIKQQLNNKVICLLQLCLNMLTKPVEAVVQLLGLPFPKEQYDEV